MKETDIEEKFDELKFWPKEFALVITLLQKDELSSNGAQEVLKVLFENWGDPKKIIEEKWLRQVNDTDLMEKIVDDVIANNPAQVEEYKAGKQQLFGFFVGQCMAASKWQGNPKIFTSILKDKLS